MHLSLIAAFGSLGPVCRLGLATRGTGRLEPGDVLHALDGGVNFLNWHGGADGLSRAITDALRVERKRGREWVGSLYS